MPSTENATRSSGIVYGVYIAGMCGTCLRSIEGIPDHCIKASPKHGRWNLGSHGPIYDFAGKVTRARIFRS